MSESGHEIWLCSCLAERSDEVVTIWIDQRSKSRANRQRATFNEVERNMPGIVGSRSVEDGKSTLAEVWWKTEQPIHGQS